MGLNYQAAVNISANFSGGPAVGQARKALKDIQQDTGAIAGGLGRATTAFKGFLGAFALQQAATRSFDFVKSIISIGDSLNDLSAKTGISAQALSALQGAAELNGVEFGSLEGALKKFTVNVAGAANGNKQLENAFRAVGVSVKNANGEIRPSGDLILGLADKFAAMEDGPTKAAIAVKLFGKSGADLIPLLNEGSDAIQRFGLKITDDFVQKSARLDDTLVLIRKGFVQLGIDGIQPLLPVLQDLADVMLDFTNDAETSVGVIEVLGEAIRQIVVVGISFGAAFVTVGEGIGLAFLAVGEIIYTFGQEAIDVLLTIGKLGAALPSAILSGDYAKLGQITDDFFRKSTANVSGMFARAGRDGDAFVDKTSKRFEALGNTISKLQKNSLFFGTPGAAAGASGQKRSGAAENAGALDDDQAEKIKKATEATEERIKKIQAETGAMGQSNAQKQIAIELAELENRGIQRNTAEYTRLAGALTEAVNAREVAKEKSAADDYLRKQTEENELRELEIRQLEFSTVEYRKLVEAKKQDAAVSEATKNFTREGAAAYREAAEAAREQRDALIEMDEQQKRSFGQGATEAMRDYVDRARDTANLTRELFTGAFNKLEDALVEFVQTGKLNFADLAAFIEQELIRIAVKKTIALGISAAFGAPATPFANGGIMTSNGSMPLNKYANGGIANSPQLALFGEGSRPEAYVPLPDGRTIPVTMKGGSGAGGGTAVNVTVNISNGTPMVEQNEATDTKGRELGRMIVAAVKNQILNEQRPGGLLA